MTSGQHPQGPQREPILNAPAAVIWAIVLLLAIHAALGFMDVRSSERLQLSLAFIPARYTSSLPLFPGDPPHAYLWSFFTHQFVHADWTHVGLNSAWLLAFGGAVATRVGVARFTAIALIGGAAGAALYLVLNWGQPSLMIGASGAVSALMGAAMRFYSLPTDSPDRSEPARGNNDVAWRMTLLQTFLDRRTRGIIGFWLVINFATAMILPLFTPIPGIAWEAHMGGFLFGLVTFALFDPAGRSLRGS